MGDGLGTLRRLARSMGVATAYRDGLGTDVVVSPETLVRVCASLGAPIERIGDAGSALEAQQADRDRELLPSVLVAWEGSLGTVEVAAAADPEVRGDLTLENGTTLSATSAGEVAALDFGAPLPMGYHQLRVEAGSRVATCTVIAAPVVSWNDGDPRRRWGISTHVAALRSTRSRSVGDLADLRLLGDWVRSHGADLVSVLPLLPTFNDPPTEPSPYSPVSRLFWSELVADLGTAHVPVGSGDLLKVERADAEVRAALAGVLTPDTPASDQPPVRPELGAYARFRAAQKRLGRDWRRWPDRQRRGTLETRDVDSGEERFHLVAQREVERQLLDLRTHLADNGVRLGLDLTVGVHPEGYDVWSRPELFATDVAVGAPPDQGFPSGQSWGFPPVVPQSSRREGHSYFAGCVAHQASVAGVLRIDHVMAMNRLYWIPEGMDLANGTYVDYPSEELFAVLSLESHRNRCQLVGEDLGTVPAVTEEALLRHRIPGMYLAEFEAGPSAPVSLPSAAQVAMIDTHDTPTFAGWLDGADIDERVRIGLLGAADAERERRARVGAAFSLAACLEGDLADPATLLAELVEWLGGSDSPLVLVSLEDLWLELQPVNIPGSTSADRPNWRRPMSRRIEEAMADPAVARLLDLLDSSRRR